MVRMGVSMKKSTKWKIYEKRWKIRDIYFNKALRRHFLLKYFHVEPVMPIFAHKKVMSKKKTNDYIAELIRSGDPFLSEGLEIQNFPLLQVFFVIV